MTRAAKLHLTLTVAWGLLVIPTLLLWRTSILWVAFMSLYANLVGHWSAYQAARAEQTGFSDEDAAEAMECLRALREGK